MFLLGNADLKNGKKFPAYSTNKGKVIVDHSWF